MRVNYDYLEDTISEEESFENIFAFSGTSQDRSTVYLFLCQQTKIVDLGETTHFFIVYTNDCSENQDPDYPILQGYQNMQGYKTTIKDVLDTFDLTFLKAYDSKYDLDEELAIDIEYTPR